MASTRSLDIDMAPTRATGTPIIAPSLLSCDFGRVAEEVRSIEAEGAEIENHASNASWIYINRSAVPRCHRGGPWHLGGGPRRDRPRMRLS